MSMPSRIRLPTQYGARAVVLVLCLLLVVPATPGQAANQAEPVEVLNGLRLLLCENPGSSDVLLNLRIKSGAASDLSGKSGQMALLGDRWFPDANTAEYFREEMGGKLEVAVNYDSTTITMVGKTSEFEQIVDTLRGALLATQLTPEVITRVRDARIKTLKDTAIAPSLVADREIGRAHV